jgi:hypothetical protein
MLAPPETMTNVGFLGFSQELGNSVPAPWRETAMLAPFLGLAMAANPWWRLTSRARPRRFRFLATAKVALFAWLIGMVWPSPQPWGTLVVVLIAIVSQVVSPWSREAAAYAWATRFDRGRRTA